MQQSLLDIWRKQTNRYALSCPRINWCTHPGMPTQFHWRGIQLGELAMGGTEQVGQIGTVDIGAALTNTGRDGPALASSEDLHPEGYLSAPEPGL